jgi:hypothetical protein
LYTARTEHWNFRDLSQWRNMTLSGHVHYPYIIGFYYLYYIPWRCRELFMSNPAPKSSSIAEGDPCKWKTYRHSSEKDIHTFVQDNLKNCAVLVVFMFIFKYWDYLSECLNRN